MTKHSCGHSRRSRPSAPASAHPVYPEPPIRRWPHSTAEPLLKLDNEAAIHYIRCSLSYQNQTLSEIKVLLERLAAENADSSTDEKNSG